MIIFGTSMFSKLMKWYVENDTKQRVSAFTVERTYITESYFCGVPVIPFEELESQFEKSEISILNTCGYHNMNDIRKKVFEMCRDEGYEICDFIHSSVRTEEVQLGCGNIILERVLIQPFVKIGDGNILSADMTVGHENCIGDFNYFSGGVKLSGVCSIGNHNFIGTNVTVKDNTKIGSYNLIGAGTYLNSNIGDFTAASPISCRKEKMPKKFLDRLVNQ